MHGNALCDCTFTKRRVTGQHVIHGAAETVNIRTLINVVAVHGLFGRKIVGGAQHFFVMHDGQRCGFLTKQGQSQVEDLDHAVGGHQQVGGFDVAMHEMVFVGML